MDLIESARCQVCDETFELDAQQQKFVAHLVTKGQRFIMIECPSCGSSTQYVKAAEFTEASNQPANYRCPITQCVGWVDLVEDQPRSFWGCGECGSIWYDEKNLQKEITDIVALHPYRAHSYKQLDGKWAPGDLSAEPANYEALVEKESADDHDQLIRG